MLDLILVNIRQKKTSSIGQFFFTWQEEPHQIMYFCSAQGRSCQFPTARSASTCNQCTNIKTDYMTTVHIKGPLHCLCLARPSLAHACAVCDTVRG